MNDFIPSSQSGSPADSRSLYPLISRDDQARDVDIVQECWPGRRILRGVCPQLLEHLDDTHLAVEDRDKLVAVLDGHLLRRASDAYYVRCAGMHPDYRGGGAGDEMYLRCAAVVRACGPISIVAETRVWSRECIAFHARRGFPLWPSGDAADGPLVDREDTEFGLEDMRTVQRLDDGGGV